MSEIVYGRGVSDMKGPAACLLHIMSELDPDLHDLAMLGMDRAVDCLVVVRCIMYKLCLVLCSECAGNVAGGV